MIGLFDIHALDKCVTKVKEQMTIQDYTRAYEIVLTYVIKSNYIRCDYPVGKDLLQVIKAIKILQLYYGKENEIIRIIQDDIVKDIFKLLLPIEIKAFTNILY